MDLSYSNLIKNTYQFPQKGFSYDEENGLIFNDIEILSLIEKHGTPFRLTYLPKIGEQINRARNLFDSAIANNNYNGEYHFCYCTKCSHFSHVLNEAMKHKVNLETSSAFDIDIALRLYSQGSISKETTIIHNGYKTNPYLNRIIDLQLQGFKNSVIVIDSEDELDRICEISQGQNLNIGIRIAIGEEPQSTFYTSRFGIAKNKILDIYNNKIRDNLNLELTMFHFFIDSGIQDSLYFWEEFQKAISSYTELRKLCPTLSNLNIGGGFPIQNHLNHQFDYEGITEQIVLRIAKNCDTDHIPHPNIYTEFGKFTVGESSATIFEVIAEKQQNEKEKWYIIDNSLMNTIPDSWSINEKFILLPINKWENNYGPANIGGISCDRSDYYNFEDLNQQITLPKNQPNDKSPLYIGFFHTGAYQDALSGYGGIKHCLIPAPKQIIVDKDSEGNLIDYVYRNEQSVEDMLDILGYN